MLTQEIAVDCDRGYPVLTQKKVNRGSGEHVLTQEISVSKDKVYHVLTQEIAVNRGRCYLVLTHEIAVNRG